MADRVEVAPPTYALTPYSWSAKQHGRPTEANLAKFVEVHNKSFEPGGVNAHVGVRIVRAYLRRNERDGEVLAVWKSGIL
jgi:hypothetical protein